MTRFDPGFRRGSRGWVSCTVDETKRRLAPRPPTLVEAGVRHERQDGVQHWTLDTKHERWWHPPYTVKNGVSRGQDGGGRGRRRFRRG